MVDIAFAVSCDALPRAHRKDLAAALDLALPWWAALPGAAVHPLNLSIGAGDLLSRRTRLTLRAPRTRAAEVMALAGSSLRVGASDLQLGPARQRELLPHGTLYAHLVAAEDSDEAAFMQRVGEELSALGVACRKICGRHQVLESGTLRGFSLMLDGLGVMDSLRMLDTGLGAHRRWGCGVFIPHKSAAAVGS